MILGHIVGIAMVIILGIALVWETQHLIDWFGWMYQEYGNGTLAGYLRVHAYTYFEWAFGDNPFGWRLE